MSYDGWVGVTRPLSIQNISLAVNDATMSKT